MARETSHTYPYYVERVGQVVPTNEQVIKGQELKRGLSYLKIGLEPLEDLSINFAAISLNGRLILTPRNPIERKVVRGDSFHEWTSPNEISFSASQLIISSFTLIDFETFTFETHSPLYTHSDGVFPLREVGAVDLLAHDLAVISDSAI